MNFNTTYTPRLGDRVRTTTGRTGVVVHAFADKFSTTGHRAYVKMDDTGRKGVFEGGDLTRDPLRTGELLRVKSPQAAPRQEEWEGTLVHTTIEWGTGRKGVTIKVTKAPAGVEGHVGYELGFSENEWVVSRVR